MLNLKIGKRRSSNCINITHYLNLAIIYVSLTFYESFLVNKFFDDFEKRGELLLIEMLLPKTAKDCYEIQYGYGSYEYIC